jgi:hypothetical protein
MAQKSVKRKAGGVPAMREYVYFFLFCKKEWQQE